MESTESLGPRQITPRWRELRRTPKAELSTHPTVIGGKLTSITNASLAKWRQTGALEDAVDAVDHAVYTGKVEEVHGLIAQILDPKSGASAAVKSTALRVSDLFTDEIARPLPMPTELVDFQHEIRRFKARLSMAPRDALARVDLARLYYLHGQLRPASRYLEQALVLAPSSRFVLRSAVRFMVDTGEPDRAYASVAKSDLVRFDPWIQAAEVATADTISKTPKWAMRHLHRGANIQLSCGSSELAAGLATFTYNHGEKAKLTRRLLRGALIDPTENALAQALWLSRQMGLPVDEAALGSSNGNANEARAAVALASEDIHGAAVEARKWFEDEPFSARAAMTLTSLNINLLGLYEKALADVKAIRQIFPQAWQLLNSEIICNIFVGRLSEAQEKLEKMKGHFTESKAVPYIYAASGLLGFHEKNIEKGRSGYSKATEAARLNGDLLPELTAYLYWLEQESRFAGMSPELRSALVENLLKRSQKLPEVQRQDFSRTVTHRIKLLAQESEQRDTRMVYHQAGGGLMMLFR